MAGKMTNSIRILHVEDCDKDAALVETFLRKAFASDKTLHRVSTLEDALSYLSENTVDLVLLDLFLPDSSGLETLSRIKTFSPDNSIIVLTGISDEEVALMSVQKGAQDYLVKDELNPRSISRAIRYAIERHHHDQRIIELASIDLLTKLPNRARFLDHLNNMIESTRRLNGDLSLLFIDCDGFKLINDTYGHFIGDEYLVAFAQRLKDTVRASDFVARMSGDEFVILTPHNHGQLRDDLVVADKIINAIAQPLELPSGESLHARCSIGITTYSGKNSQPTAEKLVKEADAAMYASKKRGGNSYSFYDAELEQQAERRSVLLRSLATSLQCQGFSLAYQPIMDAKTLRPAGLEALLRWKTETGEYIPPNQFIPLLEESGMIKPLGFWIIEQACMQFMYLQRLNVLPADAWINLNISPVQLQSRTFGHNLANVINKIGIEPSAVHLEITESVLLDHDKQTFELLNEIEEFGCQWAIDDFGTGYSSMSYLKNLPVSILKIDQSFIRGCSKDSKDLGITKAIIALAHNLDMSVVAEGVETQEIAQQLINEGCGYLQGYHYAKPMDEEALLAYLSRFPHALVNLKGA